MSDATMAALARILAERLMSFAYERREEDRKAIAEYQHLICVEYRNEQAAGEEEPTNEKT